MVEYIFNIPVASSRPNNILEMENILHSSFFFYQLVAKNVLNIGVKIILFPTKHLDSPSTESFQHVFELKFQIELEFGSVSFGEKGWRKIPEKNLSEQERRKLTIKNSTRKWRLFWVINSDHAAGRFRAVKRENIPKAKQRTSKSRLSLSVFGKFPICY